MSHMALSVALAAASQTTKIPNTAVAFVVGIVVGILVARKLSH